MEEEWEDGLGGGVVLTLVACAYNLSAPALVKNASFAADV